MGMQRLGMQAPALAVSDFGGSLISAKRTFESRKETLQKLWTFAVSLVCETTIMDRKLEIVTELSCKESYRVSSQEEITAEARMQMAEMELPLRGVFEELKRMKYVDWFSKMSRAPETEKYKVRKEIGRIVCGELEREGKDTGPVFLAVCSVEKMQDELGDMFALHENQNEMRNKLKTNALRQEVRDCMKISDND